jgi:hypothetical protein
VVADADLAYMAAILDMHGRIRLKNNQSRATPQRVLVVQSSRHGIIRKLNDLTGTKAEPREGWKKAEWDSRGCIEHCPEAHVHHEGKTSVPTVTIWTITGAAAAVILWNVIPFMTTSKGIEFEEAMNEILAEVAMLGKEDARGHRSGGQGWGVIRNSVVRLHRLGWKLPPAIAGRVARDEAAQDMRAAR